MCNCVRRGYSSKVDQKLEGETPKMRNNVDHHHQVTLARDVFAAKQDDCV